MYRVYVCHMCIPGHDDAVEHALPQQEVPHPLRHDHVHLHKTHNKKKKSDGLDLRKTFDILIHTGLIHMLAILDN